jgi:hypothetical protein
MNRLIDRLLVAAVLLTTLASPASARRVRAVHHPAEPCSYQLVPAWGTADVPAAGLTRGVVLVYGQTQACSQWLGYSAVDWVTVESGSTDAQPAAYVTVAPNPEQQVRSTTLVIAGVRLELTQAAAQPVAPPPDPGLVKNGTFDTSTADWGWPSAFPNAPGSAQWSPLDANGSPNSGSFLLRDGGLQKGFQRLQIIPVPARTDYQFSARVRPGGVGTQGLGVVAVFSCPTLDCLADYTKETERVVSTLEPGTWETVSFTFRTSTNAKAVMIVLASAANAVTFDTWFDDVELRPIP